jgi:two-component system response regulator RegA
MLTTIEIDDTLLEGFADRSCLVLDDDLVFLQRLARAMTLKGFIVSAASNLHDALDIIRSNPPFFAVVDYRLEDGSGLDALEALRLERPDARCVVLTGYGNLAGAVTAVRIGARDLLPKPSDVDDVIKALTADPGVTPEPPLNPASADRVRWEHIQSVFRQCDGNVSETARKLNMHRRTLQRILGKNRPI